MITAPTLLMTATITPPAIVTNLIRTDPAQRLRDYLWALEFYLQLPNEVLPRILFVENSDNDLAPLRELASRYPEKQVEFLSFAGLDYPPPYGRGYGEITLMNYGMDHSKIIAGLGPDDIIWKATGRLRLVNFAEMHATAPWPFEYYCDFKIYPMRWIDMRFFAVTKAAYNDMWRGLALEVRENHEVPGVSENHLYRIFKPQLGKRKIVPRFLISPKVEGVQGNGKSYNEGWKNKTKYRIRDMTRRGAPWLWI